jgi:hypothetical protein
MVMFSANYRLITLKIHLDWASKQQSALDICVVMMITVLCFNILVGAMKLVRVVIIHSFQYLGSDAPPNFLRNPNVGPIMKHIKRRKSGHTP